MTSPAVLKRNRRELAERNQRMYAMRKAGVTFRAIAKTFDITDVRVFMICKREQARESKNIMGLLTD